MEIKYPLPINKTDMELSPKLNKFVHQICESEYEKQLAIKLKEKWTLNDKYDETNKTTPYLKPYAELDWETKKQMVDEIEKTLYTILSQSIKRHLTDTDVQETDEKIEKLKPQKMNFLRSFSFWIFLIIELSLSVLPFVLSHLCDNAGIWGRCIFDSSYFYIFCLFIFSLMSLEAWIAYKQFKCQIKQNKKEYDLYWEFKRSWIEKKSGFLP